MKIGIILIGILTVGVCAALQFRTLTGMRDENARLTIAAKEAATIQAALRNEKSPPLLAEPAETEIARLREATRELPGLRNEVRQLREVTAAHNRLKQENERLRSLRSTNAPAARAVPMQPIPIALDRLSNHGQLSPEAAIQTLFWAARRGDIAALKNCFLPAQAEHIERDDPARIASSFASAFDGGGRLDIAAMREISPGLVKVGLHVYHPDGRETKAVLPVRLVGSEWKIDADWKGF